MTAIVLDTETTGLSKENDRIIEIAIVWWKEDKEFHHRFNPQIPIPVEASNVHGITDEDIKDCDLFSTHAETLYRLIANAEAFIGHNPWFDRNMIEAEFARCGLKIEKWPTMICTKRLWDAHEPNDRHLMNAYQRFVDRGGFKSAHSAMADTKACRDVLKAQIDYFGLHNTPWEEMDPERKLWWGETHHILVVDQTLIMNFGKHRGKRVTEVDHGFWRWLLERDFPKHLLMLAMETTRLIEKGQSKDLMDISLYSWARMYQKENPA